MRQHQIAQEIMLLQNTEDVHSQLDRLIHASLVIAPSGTASLYLNIRSYYGKLVHGLVPKCGGKWNLAMFRFYDFPIFGVLELKIRGIHDFGKQCKESFAGGGSVLNLIKPQKSFPSPGHELVYVVRWKAVTQ